MTPRQADKIIKAGKPVRLRHKLGEESTLLVTHRDRWNLYGQYVGGEYDGRFFTVDRGDMDLAPAVLTPEQRQHELNILTDAAIRQARGK
jgi:hypothetical protein